MAKNCIDILKDDHPKVHDYLRKKAGIDFNPESGKGRNEWIQAVQELQHDTLDQLHNVYHKIGLKDYDKPTQSSIAVIQPSENKSPNIIPLKKEDSQKAQTSQQTPQNFADRIVSGEQLTTPEDLQFYENNQEAIEEELKQRFVNSEQENIDEDEKLSPEESTKLSDALFAFADKILKADITGAGGTAALSNLFAIPQQILGRAIQAVAVAIKAHETISSAIKKGLKLLTDEGHTVEERDFSGLVKSVLAGKKPAMGRISVPPTSQPSIGGTTPIPDTPLGNDPIAAYQMTRDQEITKAFGSDVTQANVFDELPSDERFHVQMGMLEDGKNMIGAAQSMFGSTDINVYGPQLFRYIQNMKGDDAQLTNKKAVLLATFLGEIKNEMYRNQATADQLRPLNNTVSRYYTNFMHVTAKNLAAGRLLRLFRDKYMGDVFRDKILEEKQIRAANRVQNAEADIAVTDQQAADFQAAKQKGKTAEEIEAARKASAEARKQRQAAAAKRPNPKKEKYTQLAADKEAEIKTKYGDKKGLVQTIIDRIKQIKDCK